VGSGPFQLVSFTPGQETVMKRFENYFGDVWLDELHFVSFNDDAPRINALLSGDIQATEAIPPGQIEVVKSQGTIQTIESESGATRFFSMRVDQAPFDDVRVRQAMRLIAERPQMIQQSLAGYGQVGNDLFNKYDPDYRADLVRSQNIEEAKALLASAGKSGLTVELATAPYIAGIVEASQVLVEQAKAAGVTIQLKKMDLPTYFAGYGKWNFSGDFFNANEYFIQVSLNQLPNSTFNITHFDDPEYNALYAKGVAELDATKRKEIAGAMQQIEFDRGGNLVWTYATVVDAVANNVQGLVPDKYGLPLTSYGFNRAWLT
jgi:peptide/nickel transport system substrate-binding protein